MPKSSAFAPAFDALVRAGDNTNDLFLQLCDEWLECLDADAACKGHSDSRRRTRHYSVDAKGVRRCAPSRLARNTSDVAARSGADGVGSDSVANPSADGERCACHYPFSHWQPAKD